MHTDKESDILNISGFWSHGIHVYLKADNEPEVRERE